jgi:hypothetical protein
LRTVVSVRSLQLPDPLTRANVQAAFSGDGRPAGVLTCESTGDTLRITFDDAITPPELIDDLIAVESTFVPARAKEPLDRSTAARIAAQGLGDPDLDVTRVIETYLP